MTPDEFKEIRLELGLTQSKLSSLLFVANRTIQSYELGERKIPRLVAHTLYKMQEEFHNENL
jgi:transcriptional regulator with XRE-family HTH domain